MITVTNGTVSRTYKVGDYEPRVVSLSFNIDPGSDVESLVAGVVGMVERLARQNPVQEKKRRLTGDELVGETHPPTPAPIEAASMPVSVSTPEPVPVVPVIPTDEDAVQAARAASGRVGAARRHEVTAIVNKYVVEPNMPVRTMPEANRAAFIAEVSQLGKSSEY